MSLVDRLRHILRRQRRYASYFEWPHKPIKELGVVKELIKAMDSSGNMEFRSPDVGPDPNLAPDCVALDREGRPVALEVCELVSEEAIRLNQHATRLEDRVYRDWQPDDVLREIRRILEVKDSKTFHGGPYSGIVVVIHADEMTIKSDAYADLLQAQTFGPFRRITDGYFLFSYEPDVGHCPYVRLKIPAPGTPGGSGRGA